MRWLTSCAAAATSLSLRYRSILRACARISSLDAGRKLHAAIITTGLSASPDSFLLNALLHLYSACGRSSNARNLFDEIPHSHRDAVDWTALVGCFARNGSPADALRLFVQMRDVGVRPDEITMVCVFSACARVGEASAGAQVHAFVLKMGLCFGIKVCNALMDMYAKCELMCEARGVFEEMREKSVVSWTVILGCVIKWKGVESGQLFFDAMPERNAVAWTVMIVGYLESGLTRNGFLLLNEMIFGMGYVLNHVTLCSVLSACSQSGNLMMGRWIHLYALKTTEEEIDIMVGTGLVDMYAKCGRVNTAFKLFEKMPRRNVVAWNATMNGLAMHGRGTDVLNIFPHMVKETKPDDLTFTSILTACSHSGLVEKGRRYFHDLESVYGITPKLEHYACMVDLLGRAGHLGDAEDLVKKMPIPPNEVVLGSLLGACSVHGKLQLGERLLQELVEMDPHNTEYHVLLSNMYALAGKSDKANSLRQILKKRGVRKVPGMSSIHVNGEVHQFSSGDKSHPQTQKIYPMLDQMMGRLRLAGYVPDTAGQVFSASSEMTAEVVEEKEQALFSHSEKLAVCFGILNTGVGVRLHIFKNLRICKDCHSAMKLVSKIYNREIVIRDRYRFHCFKEGSCSCGDYW